jgi:hypothetical protein
MSELSAVALYIYTDYQEQAAKRAAEAKEQAEQAAQAEMNARIYAAQKARSDKLTNS